MLIERFADEQNVCRVKKGCALNEEAAMAAAW